METKHLWALPVRAALANADGVAGNQRISARKKVHELRKLFGDAIVKQNGIFAGSAQLRHSTIQMTPAITPTRANAQCSRSQSVLR